MVDQVRINCILQITASIVWEQYVDDLGPRVGAVTGVGDRIVDGGDDMLVRGEERVCFRLFQCLCDGFLAEGTADLLQGEELAGPGVLDEIDV